MTFDWTPLPHLDLSPGSLFFGELVVNALVYVLLVGLVGGVALLARDLRG